VERQERDAGVDGLVSPGAEAHDAQPRAVQLLRQLVHGDVAGRADEPLAAQHLHQLVDERGRRDGLAGAGRALARSRMAGCTVTTLPHLDEAQGSLHRRLHRVRLAVVQLRQVGRREALGQRHLDLQVYLLDAHQGSVEEIGETIVPVFQNAHRGFHSKLHQVLI